MDGQGATVYLDGSEVPANQRELLVDPGAHVLKAEHGALRLKPTSLECAAGETRDIRLEIQARDSVPARVGATATSSRRRHRRAMQLLDGLSQSCSSGADSPSSRWGSPSDTSSMALQPKVRRTDYVTNPGGPATPRWQRRTRSAHHRPVFPRPLLVDRFKTASSTKVARIASRMAP